MTSTELNEWIRTLRERTHKLTSSCTALELQVGLLEKRTAELAKEVSRMVTADEIAQGVADELRRRAQVDQEKHRSERDKIDTGMKRLLWAFGTVFTLLQIMSIFVFH